MLNIHKGKLDNFFRWVKGTELVILNEIDVKEDPVRPNLDLEFRTSHNRKIFGLKYFGIFFLIISLFSFFNII